MSCPTFVCAASYSMAALLVAKLTPAEVTPLAPASASWTVAAQLAHVIPSMGRTIRVLLMAGLVGFLRGGGGAAPGRRAPHRQPPPAVSSAAERGIAPPVRGGVDGPRV